MSKFDNYLFHASSLGKIMTDARKGEGLGETCKAHLLECWIEETYGRRNEFTNKYVQKGLQVEEDSITLYSRCKSKLYFKNYDQVKNDFVIGTPDIIEEDHIIDIKSSWNIFTFFAVLHKPINKAYEYQLIGYTDMLKKKYSKLAYCLVDTPFPLIDQEKRKLKFDMGIIDPQEELHPEFFAACEQIDKNSLFDDIPIEKRYIEFTINQDQKKVADIYTRIKECREFLNSLS